MADRMSESIDCDPNTRSKMKAKAICLTFQISEQQIKYA